MLSRTKVDQTDDDVTGLLVFDGFLDRALYLDSIESSGE